MDKITPKQLDYLQILFNDLQLNTLQRNDWLSFSLNREIHFLDELSKTEASYYIGILKRKKEEFKHRQNLADAIEDEESRDDFLEDISGRGNI